MGVTNYYTVNGVILGEEDFGAGTARGYATDALGSVTNTVTSGGLVQNTYRYKPYGAQLAKTGAAADPAFTWIGTLGYRSSTRSFGSEYVRARSFAPELARWTTVDARRLLGSSRFSAYCYALCSPTSNVDPGGDESLWEKFINFLWNNVFFNPNTGQVPPNSCIYQSAVEETARISSTTDYDYFTWGWGNCCGLKRQCGPAHSNGSCTDDACDRHDHCVGSSVLNATFTWTPCTIALCNELKACYAKNGCSSQVTASSECQACWEAGTAMCASVGMGFP